MSKCVRNEKQGCITISSGCEWVKIKGAGAPQSLGSAAAGRGLGPTRAAGQPHEHPGSQSVSRAASRPGCQSGSERRSPVCGKASDLGGPGDPTEGPHARDSSDGRRPVAAGARKSSSSGVHTGFQAPSLAAADKCIRFTSCPVQHHLTYVLPNRVNVCKWQEFCAQPAWPRPVRAALCL